MSVRMSIFRKKPELSQAQFTAYWRDVHAPLAVTIPGLQLYEQNCAAEQHAFGDPGLVQSADGFCKLRFEDEAAMQSVMSPEMTRILMEDEAKFIEGLRTFVLRSKPVLQPATGAATKCMALVTRRTDLDPAAFERVWSGDVARRVKALLGAVGYVQHFVTARTADRRPVRYEQSPVDCIDELWLSHPAGSGPADDLLRAIENEVASHVAAMSIAVVTVNVPPIPRN